jgi:hypothetical protein
MLPNKPFIHIITLAHVNLHIRDIEFTNLYILLGLFKVTY